MPGDESAEKTEQPTPRRRQEARRRGQVPRSTDLTAAIALLAGLLLLNWLGPAMFERLLELVRGLGESGDPSAGPHRLLTRGVHAGISVLAPFVLCLLIVTAGGSILQTGAVVAWSRLSPRFDNLNPANGLKRLLSAESLTRAGMGVLKMVLLGAVAYSALRGRVNQILFTAALEPISILSLVSQLLFTLALRMAVVLLILGLIDYFYQRWKLERDLRMSKQEVRDELKQMEGDPHVRARRRQLQARIAMQRIRADVPKADVVVTNPTEFAVALQYDEATMRAPRVLAKGADLLALHIRQVAQAAGVPLVQRPPLARGLYYEVEVGQEVPQRFYRALAEVLAYVYQLAGRVPVGAARSAQPSRTGRKSHAEPTPGR